MPHSCSNANCAKCYLRTNKVTVFHLKLKMGKLNKKDKDIEVDAIAIPSYLKDEDVFMLTRMAVELFEECYTNYKREPIIDEHIFAVDPFFTCSLTRTTEPKMFVFSFVTYPKPTARAPINQDPRPAATTAAPRVEPEEGDDPSDSSE
ncbi:MAG: hypothetical protein EBU08_17795 [Micrococcales bacterium]|nr:hypothetical protein [Micrococcales bacterium]